MIKDWLTSLTLHFHPKSRETLEFTAPPVSTLPTQTNRDDLVRPQLSPVEEDVQSADLAQAATQTSKDARKLITFIEQIRRETDPPFLRLGKELQEIYGAAIGLTDAIQTATSHLSHSEDGESCLEQTSFLIDNAWKSLNDAQGNIENSISHVLNLISHIEKFTAICEMITRIGLWFRVVGVNIEVECNIQGLSGEMFSGVSKEVNDLSRKINQMVASIRNDLATTASRLTSLDHASTSSLEEIRGMATKAEGIVRNSYEDIKQLMAETTALIDSAKAKAGIIGEKVGEVVVGIQFHDAMSQRIEHIIEALRDIEMLCEQSRKAETPETLGSICIILDFQKRQLQNLTTESRTLALTTQESFHVICSEVSEMSSELAGSGLTEQGKQPTQVNFFQPLQQGLRQLGGLLSTGNDMLNTLHHSAEETAAVSDHLLEMIKGVKQIREETHIMAINTIIMAIHLGDKGRTIEVLAKEIRSLADQTGEMVDGVSVVQGDIVSGVTALRESISRESGTINAAGLEQGVTTIGESYGQVQMGISTIAKEAGLLTNRINGVATQLSFLENLGAKMELSSQNIDKMLEILEPWRNSGQVHDENILRLLSRYTMDQERVVHSSGEDIFADAPGNQGAAGSTSFDDNVELF
jgi:methyl-accepting chemotaxis protein